MIVTPPSPESPRREQHRQRLERQMAALQRLGEIGMELAEAVGQRVAAAKADEAAGAAPAQPPSGDEELKFARVARAATLAMTQEARLSSSLLAMDEGKAEGQKAWAEHMAGARERLIARLQRIMEAEDEDLDAADDDVDDDGEDEDDVEGGDGAARSAAAKPAETPGDGPASPSEAAPARKPNPAHALTRRSAAVIRAGLLGSAAGVADPLQHALQCVRRGDHQIIGDSKGGEDRGPASHPPIEEEPGETDPDP